MTDLPKKRGPKPKEKSATPSPQDMTTFTLYISKGELHHAKELAYQTRQSLSVMIRVLLADHMTATGYRDKYIDNNVDK